MNMINLLGRGPLPKSQFSESDFKDLGICSQLNTSPRTFQHSLDNTHWNRIWSMVSHSLPKQHLPFPFHPLLTKLVPTASLLLNDCHKKNLIFSGILHFQIMPQEKHAWVGLDKILIPQSNCCLQTFQLSLNYYPSTNGKM
jgi:hypothetical protein